MPFVVKQVGKVFKVWNKDKKVFANASFSSRIKAENMIKVWDKYKGRPLKPP
jgi:hypothetical protein